MAKFINLGKVKMIKDNFKNRQPAAKSFKMDAVHRLNGDGLELINSSLRYSRTT
jgi:hypothetical protein